MTGPLRLTSALHMELGQLEAEALRIDGPEVSHTLWAAAGLAMLARVFQLQGWSLSLELNGLVPLIRTRWLIRTQQGDVAAFVADPLVLRVAVRVGYAIW